MPARAADLVAETPPARRLVNTTLSLRARPDWGQSTALCLLGLTPAFIAARLSRLPKQAPGVVAEGSKADASRYGLFWHSGDWFSQRRGARRGYLAKESFGGGGQSRFEPPPRGLIRRQAEAQPARIVGEGPHEDSGTPEVMKQRVGRRRLRQPEQARPADDLETGALEDGIEPTRGPRQPAPRPLDPPRVRERLGADGERRSGYRPRAERGAQPRRHRRRCERETEPEPGEPEEFSERAQHDDVAVRHLTGKARPRRADIHEGFVDHQHAAARPQIFFGQREQGISVEKPAVGIVWIGDHDEIGVGAGVEFARGFHAVPGERRGAGKFAVARDEHRRAARWNERGDQRQQQLRARRQHDVRRRRARHKPARRSPRASRRLRATAAGRRDRPESAAADRDWD